MHAGWQLPRQGGWSCGRLARSIKCRSYDLPRMGVGSSMGRLRCRNWRQLAWAQWRQGRQVEAGK